MQTLVKSTVLFVLTLSSFVQAMEIEGSWQSGCFKVDQMYERDTLSFTAQNAILKMEMAQGKNCRSAVDVVITTTYQIGPTAQSTPSANEFDMVLSTATMTPRSGFVAGYLNSSALCGFSDWKANESKEVQGLNCGGKMLPKAGDGIYDLIQVQANKLLRGKYTADHDGSSVDKRPLELNALLEFIKQ